MDSKDNLQYSKSAKLSRIQKITLEEKREIERILGTRIRFSPKSDRFINPELDERTR